MVFGKLLAVAEQEQKVGISNPYLTLTERERKQFAAARVYGAKMSVKLGAEDTGENRPETSKQLLDNGVDPNNR